MNRSDIAIIVAVKINQLIIDQALILNISKFKNNGVMMPAKQYFLGKMDGNSPNLATFLRGLLAIGSLIPIAGIGIQHLWVALEGGSSTIKRKIELMNDSEVMRFNEIATIKPIVDRAKFVNFTCNADLVFRNPESTLLQKAIFVVFGVFLPVMPLVALVRFNPLGYIGKGIVGAIDDAVRGMFRRIFNKPTRATMQEESMYPETTKKEPTIIAVPDDTDESKKNQEDENGDLQKTSYRVDLTMPTPMPASTPTQEEMTFKKIEMEDELEIQRAYLKELQGPNDNDGKSSDEMDEHFKKLMRQKEISRTQDTIKDLEKRLENLIAIKSDTSVRTSSESASNSTSTTLTSSDSSKKSTSFNMLSFDSFRASLPKVKLPKVLKMGASLFSISDDPVKNDGLSTEDSSTKPRSSSQHH